MRATAVLVLALVVLGSVMHSSQAIECCANIVTHAAYDNCHCLEDDSVVTNQHVEEGEYVNYHWRLVNWNHINVPDDQRPSIEIIVSPCVGNTHLFVTPISYPFPTAETARWSATNDYQPNGVRSKLLYAEYMVSVYGAMASNYSIIAIVNETAAASPGGGGSVLAVATQDDETILFEGDTMSMSVEFEAGNVDAQYRVYGAQRVSGPCAEGGDASKCIMSSGCGLLEGAASPMTDWESHAAGEKVSISVSGLEQNTPYVFNVAMRDGDYAVAYAATQGTPTYQRITQAQSNTTIMIVASVAGAVFLILVLLIVWAKMRLNRAYQRHQYMRYAPAQD